MKKLILILFPVILFAFDIADFKCEMLVRKDESMIITETIEVDFGQETWHGIERFITYKYRRAGHKYNIRIDILSVTDEKGRKVNLKKTKSGSNLVLRLGDADEWVSGTKFYIIKYKVQRAVNYFDSDAEVYWNITGNEWKIPIRKAHAEIKFPSAITKDQIQVKCFTGRYGESRSDCTSRIDINDKLYIEANRPITPGQGLTFASRIPKAIMKPPSKSQETIWFLQDNFDYILGPIIFLITLIIMIRIWMKKGRDPLDIHAIMVRYNPPEELQPAQAGSLYDESVDMRDITSTIIDLAVRGYIRIEEIKTDKFLFFSNKDFRLVQLKDYSELKNFEVTLMQALFSYGSTYDPTGADTTLKSVLISELKNKFYEDLRSIKTAIENSLVDEGCFDEAPQDTIKKYAFFSMFGFVFAIIGFVFFKSFVIAISFILAGAIIGLIAKFMPAKTRKGATLARHILGFKEFVHRVEKDKLERMAKDDPTMFDRLLPYAMALGVEDHWANAFSDIYREPPNWYRGYSAGSAFTTAAFVNSLGGAMNTMGNSMASTPRGSSAGSGGSGFSGGGFSGGGFGGGGGGGW